MNYYNEIDGKAASVLRELIADGLIPDGKVDERSIVDVRADELRGFRQCHFFAGGGFWSLALEWAGLGSADGVWTGSCPCQPFSCAGAGKGTADERHLWPVFFGLIRECRPRVVFGEQVASAAVVGKVGGRAEGSAGPVWVDGVRSDVEAAGYAFGFAVLGAHSVGAPHIRQRVYWVADANGSGCLRPGPAQPEERRGDSEPVGGVNARRDTPSRLHDASAVGPQDGPRVHGEHDRKVAGDGCEPRRPPDAELPDGRGEQQPGEPGSGRGGLGGSGESGGASLPPSGGQRADGGAPGTTGHADELRAVGGASDVYDAGSQGRQRGELSERAGKRTAGSAMPWRDYCVHRYLDGKDRRIPAEPGLFPLADDRHPLHRGRVGILRLAGNAIVPALAAEFVMAWVDASNETRGQPT